MKKIIVFGVGYLWENKRNKIKSEAEILAFIDNNCKLWGTEQEGVKIYPPIEIKHFKFDYVVIMNNRNFSVMREQLLGYHIAYEKIKHYEEFVGELSAGLYQKYSPIFLKRRTSKKIIIFGYELMYIGSSLTAKYAAESLYERGYNLTIVAVDGQRSLIDELVSEGIEIIIYPNLKYVIYDELTFLDEYDHIIVNTFSLLNLVHEISSHRKLIWWLHDQIYAYNEYLARYNNLNFNFDNIDVYAVSDIAKKNFNIFFPNISAKIMPYGFYDEKQFFQKSMSDNNSMYNPNKIIFAIIGYINYIKGQDIFLKAAIELKSDDVEFWIIGKDKGTTEYFSNIRRLADQIPNIKFWGEIPRSKIKYFYQRIDVVVNSSREDMLPTVVAEGMMFSKICITSDATGMANYIKDGVNGFIFKTEDYLDLYKKFLWILDNQEQLDYIKQNARQTYENNFMIDCLGKRLEDAILERA